MMKTLFTVALIGELLFAIGFLVAPGAMIGPDGANVSGFVNFARLFGSALLGLVVLLWYGRSSTNPEVHRVVLVSLFAYWLVSSVLMLLVQLSAAANPAGWVPLVYHLGFLIAFGVFVFKK